MTLNAHSGSDRGLGSGFEAVVGKVDGTILLSSLRSILQNREGSSDIMQFVQSSTPSAFVNPQWIITPISTDRQLLVLSGAVISNFASTHKSGWTSDPAVDIAPDQDLLNVVTFLKLGPPPANQFWGFQADQYATFGGLTSVFDKNTAVNAGFAVDSFAPLILPNEAGSRIVGGVQLALAVQDSDATILRVGYHLMAIGQFVAFSGIPIQ